MNLRSSSLRCCWAPRWGDWADSRQTAQNRFPPSHVMVTITFDQPVTVTGAPQAALGIGANTRPGRLRFVPHQALPEHPIRDRPPDRLIVLLRTPGVGLRRRRHLHRRQRAGAERRHDPRRRGRGRRARPRLPRHRQPPDLAGGGRGALLRGDAGSPALPAEPAGERPAPGGDRRRRRADLQPLAGGAARRPLLERRHAHDLRHADERDGGGLLHAGRHRRRRRRGDADLRPLGGDRPGGERPRHHFQPGVGRRLRRRRDDHGGRDLRPDGHGDGRAEPRAHHRQHGPAGDGEPRFGAEQDHVPLPGGDERPGHRRHLHRRRRPDPERRHHPQRQGRGRAARPRLPRRRRRRRPQGVDAAPRRGGEARHDGAGPQAARRRLGQSAVRLGGPAADRDQPLRSRGRGRDGGLRPGFRRQRQRLAEPRADHRRPDPAGGLQRLPEPGVCNGPRQERLPGIRVPLHPPALGLRRRRHLHRRRRADPARRHDLARRGGRDRPARPRHPRHHQRPGLPGGGHRARLRHAHDPAAALGGRDRVLAHPAGGDRGRLRFPRAHAGAAAVLAGLRRRDPRAVRHAPGGPRPRRPIPGRRPTATAIRRRWPSPSPWPRPTRRRSRRSSSSPPRRRTGCTRRAAPSRSGSSSTRR